MINGLPTVAVPSLELIMTFDRTLQTKHLRRAGDFGKMVKYHRKSC